MIIPTTNDQHFALHCTALHCTALSRGHFAYPRKSTFACSTLLAFCIFRFSSLPPQSQLQFLFVFPSVLDPIIETSTWFHCLCARVLPSQSNPPANPVRSQSCIDKQTPHLTLYATNDALYATTLFRDSALHSKLHLFNTQSNIRVLASCAGTSKLQFPVACQSCQMDSERVLDSTQPTQPTQPGAYPVPCPLCPSSVHPPVVECARN